MMLQNWQPHTLMSLMCGGYAEFALVDKYSFIVIQEENGWFSSWQDRYKGGSASNTREGPFKSIDEAKANCDRILMGLQRKQ